MSFTPTDWEKIRAVLAASPQRYGLPGRVYGSAVLGSFNIRKLGRRENRSEATWDFLSYICSHFDLLSVQEIMDDLEGFQELRQRLGYRFDAIVSDKTGAFPGEPGLGERLGFLYNRDLIERGDVVSDVSFDRSKILETLARSKNDIDRAIEPYAEYLREMEAWESGEASSRPKKPKVKMPVFLTFIRQPFCASFTIKGYPGTEPYRFMGVNAHLYYGNFSIDRRLEFDALMEWMLSRFTEGKAYYPNFILLGDLNLDFNSPKTDRARIEKRIKSFNEEMQLTANVNFPFLDVHPSRAEVFRTNARQNQTFDQIGLFSRDIRLPTYRDNSSMGTNLRGPDYGVFNFVELFANALYGQFFEELKEERQKDLFAKFEHEISDHLPLWLRLPLPDN